MSLKIWIFSSLLVNGVISEGTCSKNTDKPVEDCPRNKISWIEAEKRKNCSQFATKDCDYQDLQYHCLLDAYGNGTVEVCAKLTYLQGYCAEYNPLTFSIKNHGNLRCLNFTAGKTCPSRYKSTDAYLYSHCYDMAKKARTSRTNTFLQGEKEEVLSKGELGALISFVLIIFLPIFVFFLFMGYQVLYRHRQASEVLRNIPFCGQSLSKIKCIQRNAGLKQELDQEKEGGEEQDAETDDKESSDVKSPEEQTPLLPKETEDHSEKVLRRPSDINGKEESSNEASQHGTSENHSEKVLRRPSDINGKEESSNEASHHGTSEKETLLYLQETGEEIPLLLKETADHSDIVLRRPSDTDTNADGASKRAEDEHPEEKESMKKYPRLGEKLQKDIQGVDMENLVKSDDRLKAEEIKKLMPKLNPLMDRLDAFRSLPQKVKCRLKSMGSFGEKFRAKEVVVFKNKIVNFKKKLKRAEDEVNHYLQCLSTELKIEENEDLGAGENSYEKRITRLEEKIKCIERIVE